jgi:hypothetical protein
MGTGEICDDDYNKMTTLVKQKTNEAWATADSCGYNFNLGGSNQAKMTYDSTSGFATEMVT